MKPRERLDLATSGFRRILVCLLFLAIQIQAQGIHHNLPDNLEIIDPKMLGLSGTDLEKFLGNVKVLPLEGAFGTNSGSPKAQILTVGFDGSEQLNLQDFESLSTAGLPEADKHVAEMAFKKFQTFFKNPKSAQNFDEALAGITAEDGNDDEAYGSSTPSTTTSTTTQRGVASTTPTDVKHRKRVRIGKRPIFSSTYRSVDPLEDAELGTTERAYVSSAPQAQPRYQSHMRPINYQLHQHPNLQTGIGNLQQSTPHQHQFVNQLSPTYQSTESQLRGQNIQGNYHMPPAQLIGTQPHPPPNSIHQINYNLETSTPIIQGGQMNQNALRASMPNHHHQKHQYPYVPKQQQFTLSPKQRPFQAVRSENRNPGQSNDQRHHQSVSQHQSPTVLQQSPGANQQQQYFQFHNEQQIFSQGGTRELEEFEQQLKQQQHRFVPPSTPTQNRQQKQIPTPPPLSGNYQQGQAQNAAQFHGMSQEFVNHHHHFEKIQQHRFQNQGFRNSAIRPSQVDPLPSQELNQAVPSRAAPLQPYKAPKRINMEKPPQAHQFQSAAPPYRFQQPQPQQSANHFQQHQPQQFSNHFQRYPQTTPKSVSMSGVVQITPSTPLVPLSTVENAMTAHKTIMQMHHGHGKEAGSIELGQNRIPGSSEPFHEFPETKPSFHQQQQHSTRFQAQFPPQNIQHSAPLPPRNIQHSPQLPTPSPLPVIQGRPPQLQQFQNHAPHHQQHPFPRQPPSRLPAIPAPPQGFRLDPIPGEGQPASFPHFMPEPSRYISAPPPHGEFRDFSQPIGVNQVPTRGGFNFREQKNFPVMTFRGKPHALQNQPPMMVLHPQQQQNFYSVKHNPNQMNHMTQYRQFPQHQPSQELQLELAPPPHHNLRMPLGNNGGFPPREDPRFHSEATNYAAGLGLNVQSINSAPLIGSFRAP